MEFCKNKKNIVKYNEKCSFNIIFLIKSLINLNNYGKRKI